MATITDKNCVYYPKSLTTLDVMRGVYSKCKPGCVHTMYKMFGFDLTPDQKKYFLSYDPIPYEECLKYSNCQPTCIDKYRNAGTPMAIADDSKNVVVQQDAINTQLQQSKNKTYLLVGVGVLGALALTYFGTRN